MMSTDADHSATGVPRLASVRAHANSSLRISRRVGAMRGGWGARAATGTPSPHLDRNTAFQLYEFSGACRGSRIAIFRGRGDDEKPNTREQGMKILHPTDFSECAARAQVTAV